MEVLQYLLGLEGREAVDVRYGGDCALRGAFDSCRRDIIDLLVSHGASLEAVLASSPDLLLHQPCLKGDIGMVDFILSLEAGGRRVPPFYDGGHILVVACLGEQLELAKHLLEADAEAKLVPRTSLNQALYFTIRSGNAELLDLLLRQEVEHLRVDLKGDYHTLPPVYQASADLKPDVMKVLLAIDDERWVDMREYEGLVFQFAAEKSSYAAAAVDEFFRVVMTRPRPP